VRHRFARIAMLGLILIFPPLVHSASASAPTWPGRAPDGSAQAAPILVVEIIVVGGLLIAGLGRRRLQPVRVRADVRRRYVASRRSLARLDPGHPADALPAPKRAATRGRSR
jgi:hypothetical protein